ncbi:MAG: flagellar hook-associated protein FlgK [Dethiobacteria bacterium]
MSLFGSLEIGRSALMAQYKGMEVSGQNVANANTLGYTRQRVDMEAIIPAIVAGNQIAPGQGVRISDITRISSEFYHTQMVRNGSYKAYWETMQEAYRSTEVSLMEPSEEGVGKLMEDFFDIWHHLSAAPESIAVRMGLRDQAITFTRAISDNYNRLNEFRRGFIDETEATVIEINRLASEIAGINEKLIYLHALQEKSNEMFDQLDLALEELGKLIDITVYQKNNGAADVFIGGRLLVQDQYAFHVHLQTREDPGALYDKYEIINHRGLVLDPQSGRLAGLLEAVNDTIPSVQEEMNFIVTRLVEEVNALHVQGYGLDFVNGRNFFNDILANDAPASLQISVNQEIIDDPARIGAASEIAQPGNGEISLALGRLRMDKTMNGTTSFSDYYRGLITAVGVKGMESDRMTSVYEKTEMQLRERHRSITGVNIDEEAINMIQFQNAWQGAAKFINYIDEMLAVLLNIGYR